MISQVIGKRAQFSMGEITELIRQRLSFFNLFMLYDEIEMSRVQLNADMHLQNEKLEFLFKTLSERDRRQSKKEMAKQWSEMNLISKNDIYE